MIAATAAERLELDGLTNTEVIAAVVEDEVFDRWLSSLCDAYQVARGQRLSELRGAFVKKYDDRGLHVYSELWGQVTACEALVPWLSEARGGDLFPASLRAIATEDAYDAFVAEIREGEPT